MLVSALLIITDIHWVSYSNVKTGNTPRQTELFTGFVPGVTWPEERLGLSAAVQVFQLELLRYSTCAGMRFP